MAKTWVLDTETKGTGAHIAPLKRGERAKSRELALVRFRPPTAAGGSASSDAKRSVSAQAMRFKVVDILLTNFHLPRSSLLLLIDAFTGGRWRPLYETALARGYRYAGLHSGIRSDSGMRVATGINASAGSAVHGNCASTIAPAANSAEVTAAGSSKVAPAAMRWRADRAIQPLQ